MISYLNAGLFKMFKTRGCNYTLDNLTLNLKKSLQLSLSVSFNLASFLHNAKNV